MADAVSFCEGCHRDTTTILGKCANCWYVKNPSAMPAPRRYSAPLWTGDDLASFVWGWASWAPGLVAVVCGLVFDSTVLIVAGGGLLAARLVGPFVFDDWFW
jgi:hypothetical protein